MAQGDHAPPPPPILPIEMVEEIIIRFPVKFLLQLRCVCKSWNALISNPKFARRHLRRLNRRFLLVEFSDTRTHVTNLMSYPLPSVLKPVTTGGTQIDSPPPNHWIMASCDGIICSCKHTLGSGSGSRSGYSFVFWNPCIRKFWESTTPLEMPYTTSDFHGFGYDNLSDSFKLVLIFYREHLAETHVMVHTLGSNSWRKIQDFPGIPYAADNDDPRDGKFVSGALNWLIRDGDGDSNPTRCIISLDLAKESYQTILQPDFGIEVRWLNMEVMRDCLCLLANDCDVWIMKEYGNSDSWTKLFSFSLPTDFWNTCFLVSNSLCVLEDDESLFFDCVNPDTYNLNSYNYKSGTVRSSALEYKPRKDFYIGGYVEIESLISPFPQN